MKVRELLVRIGVVADDQDLDKFESKIGDVKDAVGDLVGWLAKLAAGFAAVTGGAAAIAAKTADWSEEVVRNADALGMATSKYQELHFAFNQLGASTDDMMDAFSTLTDRALDAAEGSQTYVDEFERIGIAVDDLRGKRPDQIFDMYVKATQQAEDRTAAVASAVRLFGDDLGRRIMPALTTAADDFDKWRQMAQESGIVMDEAFIRKARVVRREWRALRGRFQGLIYTVGEQLMPTFSMFIERLASLIDYFRGNGEAVSLFSTFALKLGEDLEKLWDVAGRLAEAFSFGTLEEDAIGLYEVVKGILLLITGSSVASVISSIVGLIATTGVAASAAIAAKAIAIAAIVAGILVVIEDIVGFFLGWDSVTGRILERFGEGAGLLDSISRFIEDAAEFWKEIEPIVVYIGKVLSTVIWETLVSIARTFKAIFGLVVDIGAHILRMGTAVVRFFKKILEGDIKGAFLGLFADVAQSFSTLLRDLLVGLFKVAMSVAERFMAAVAPIIESIPGVDGDALESFRKMSDMAAEGLNSALTFDVGGGIRADQAAWDRRQSSRSPKASERPGFRVNPAAVAGTQYEAAARQKEAAAKRAKEIPSYGRAPITVEKLVVGESMSKPKQKRETIDAMSKVQRMSYADASGGER